MKELNNFKNNYNIDMKLKPLSKVDKRDTPTSRKFGD